MLKDKEKIRERIRAIKIFADVKSPIWTVRHLYRDLLIQLSEDEELSFKHREIIKETLKAEDVIKLPKMIR